MSNFTRFVRLCALIFSLQLNCNFFAQGFVQETSFDNQINQSFQIIEGEVIAKKSFWDKEHSKIYTVNTIKVFKVFKGSSIDEIKLITPGGTVGLEAQKVHPSLQLRKNEKGLFFLTHSTKDVGLDGNNLFEAYGASQGYYHYDLNSNIAANQFKEFDITSELYPKVLEITGQSYIELNRLERPNKQYRTAAPTEEATITSISPLTLAAGTKDILTIKGTGFTNEQGFVGFPYADTGGRTLINAYEHQILSWTNTEIRVEVPSFAGTGPVRVRTTIGTQFFSDELTIIYAHINLNDAESGEGPADATREDLTQMINDDGNGGYNWMYNTEFNTFSAAKAAFKRAFDLWVCNTGVNWTIGGVNEIDETTGDGVNIIRFDNGDELPSNILGRTTSYFRGCNVGDDIRWFADEYDIVFNDDINWEFGPANPSGPEIDFETVAIHELGHAALLAHIIDRDAIMHYAIGFNVANRELSANDIIGAEAMMNRSINEQVCGQPRASVSSCSLSVKDLLTENILVFPNPTNNTLNIKGSGQLSITSAIVYDVRGRDIISKSFRGINESETIDLSQVGRGIYFVKIESSEGSLTKKIIVK